MSAAPELSQDLINDFVGNAHGNFARVKELLDQHPALVNASAAWGETAIEAAAQTGSVEITNLLLAAGAPTGICTEAMLGHAENVRKYLQADSSAANARGAHGIPALYHTVIRGHQNIAEMLLASGADVNLDEGGNPALHGAVLFRRPAMVEWLLTRGAHVNARNYDGKTPLAVALENQQTEIADLLRQHGGSE